MPREMNRGDYVYDKDLKLLGMVTNAEDEHNVMVIYNDPTGSGLYCTVKDCDEYDNSLVSLYEFYREIRDARRI